MCQLQSGRDLLIQWPGLMISRDWDWTQALALWIWVWWDYEVISTRVCRIVRSSLPGGGGETSFFQSMWEQLKSSIRLVCFCLTPLSEIICFSDRFRSARSLGLRWDYKRHILILTHSSSQFVTSLDCSINKRLLRTRPNTPPPRALL